MSGIPGGRFVVLLGNAPPMSLFHNGSARLSHCEMLTSGGHCLAAPTHTHTSYLRFFKCLPWKNQNIFNRSYRFFPRRISMMKTLKRRGTVWPAISFKSTVKARRSATWWFQRSIPRRCLRCLRCRNRLQDRRPSTALAHGPPQSVWKDQFTSQHIVQKPVPQRCFTFHWIVVLLFPGRCCGSTIWLPTAGNKLIFHRLVPLRWLPAVKAFFLLADLTNAIGLTLVRSMRWSCPPRRHHNWTTPQATKLVGSCSQRRMASMPLVVALMVGRERQRQWSGWKLQHPKLHIETTPEHRSQDVASNCHSGRCNRRWGYRWSHGSHVGRALLVRVLAWLLCPMVTCCSLADSLGTIWRRYKLWEDVEILPSTNAVNTSFLQAWRKHLHGKLMMQPQSGETSKFRSHHGRDFPCWRAA